MKESSTPHESPTIADRLRKADRGYRTVRTTIRDYRRGRLVSEQVIHGNILVTGGITLLWDALRGESVTAFSNANAHIGVGNGDTAASASDTGLAGASKFYIAMADGFPQVDGNKITFEGTAGEEDANFDWQEFSVRNASSEATGTALNRKVQAMGVKTDSVTRKITVEITLE